MRRVSVRDERTWESSCEYGLFRSPAMAVSVDAVTPPATPRGLHPRQRASFLPRLVEHHPPRRYSPVESRALPRAAAGRYESRRLVRLALGPFRWFRPNPRACTCEIAPPRRPSGALVSNHCLAAVWPKLHVSSRASTFCFRVAESRPETTRAGSLDAHRAPRGTPDVPLPTKEGIES